MDVRRPRRRWGEKSLAVAVSLLAHGLFVLLAIFTPAIAPPMVQQLPVEVSIIEAPRPPGPKAPGPKAATPSPPAAAKTVTLRPKATPQQTPVRPTPRPLPTRVEPVPVSRPAKAPPAPSLSDAELASAATAGSGASAGGGGGGGGGGGRCDMIRLLQSALREDARVQAAVASAHGRSGRAMHVWNGDWVVSPGEEGEGLAVVRQAIMVEVAFAPAACKADPVRGLVLISLADHAGAPRLVLGQGVWRWSDVLQPRWMR